MLNSQNNIDSVLNELKILQKMDHPNIIKYYESYKDKNEFCIVMEYADNG